MILYLNHIVTIKQKSRVDAQSKNRKYSKHIIREKSSNLKKWKIETLEERQDNQEIIMTVVSSYLLIIIFNVNGLNYSIKTQSG